MGDFCISREPLTVPLTQISCNTVLFKSQNPRKAGTLCICTKNTPSKIISYHCAFQSNQNSIIQSKYLWICSFRFYFNSNWRIATLSIGFWQQYLILNRELLETKERWKNNLPPLMIVLGDHGMADAGGHGGSSPAEVMTPMIFITPKVIYWGVLTTVRVYGTRDFRSLGQQVLVKNFLYLNLKRKIQVLQKMFVIIVFFGKHQIQ